MPVGVYRFGSVLALLSFSATGCIVVPQTQDGSEYLLAANGLFRGTSEGGESNIMSVLGAFYYISTHNGSTDIVTNADGAPVARFVYEPFGKVNSDLTDLDPDRNGVHYGEQFQFTGQEFEPETGLYNYKARIYDAETGRFLQPDPVHTDQPGQDNWDRYQYVWNNPVNFVDPDGEVVSCGFNTMLGHRFTGPSTCSDTLPNKLNELMIFYMQLSAISESDQDRQGAMEIAMLFALQKYQQFKNNQGQTPVDKASFRHDVESPGKFFTGVDKWDAIESDWRWIREGVGNFFNPKEWGRQFERNWSAQPEWIGRRFGDVGRGIVAVGSTFFAMYADLVVLTIGVPLFLIHTAFNLIGIGIERATNVRKERWMMRQERFYMSSARSNRLLLRSARFNRPFMPSARYHKLDHPSKWSL